MSREGFERCSLAVDVLKLGACNMHFVCETHFVTPLILKHTDINNAFANRQHVYIVFNATSTTTFHGFGIFYHTIYVIAIFKQTNSHLY